MTIPKHPLHAQFDEILAEIFEVKDNWYFSKINFVFIFFIANFLRYFFIDFKDQGQICNLLVMRIPKLTLIIEIDEELTEIFKVKGKAQFPKRRWKHESNFCCRKVKSTYCTTWKISVWENSQVWNDFVSIFLCHLLFQSKINSIWYKVHV